MTAQLPSRERLEEIASYDLNEFSDNPGLREEWQLFARALLAAHEQEPVATAYRLFDKSNEVAHPWKFAKGALPESEGDIFRVEVMPLYTHPAPVPAVPDGYVLMPMKLTAENGAKYAPSGEFHVLHRVTCHECGGEGCSDCDDDGWLEEKITIGWDDIKNIYRAAVAACCIKSTAEGV